MRVPPEPPLSARQNRGEARTRLRRFEYFVDVPGASSGPGRAVLLAVGGLQFGTKGVRVLGVLELAALEDGDGSWGAHDGDLGVRPRECVVGAEVASVHHDVRAAIRLPQDD